MKQSWILFAVLLVFIHSSTVFSAPYVTRGTCKIDTNNKSITIHNLKNNCNFRQLQQIFSNLSIGTFPNGKLKGHVLPSVVLGPGADVFIGSIWQGKNFRYARGTEHDHGAVINTVLGMFQYLRAEIYRTNASIDGKEAFAIDYKNEFFAFLAIDYVRQVQKNLYLGYVIVRGFERDPIAFFLLESV